MFIIMGVCKVKRLGGLMVGRLEGRAEVERRANKGGEGRGVIRTKILWRF